MPGRLSDEKASTLPGSISKRARARRRAHLPRRQRAMSTPAPVEAPTAAFAALGDENRFLILTVLSRYPAGASATTLAADMPVTRQAVSKHLQVLSHAGLVANHRRGCRISATSGNAEGRTSRRLQKRRRTRAPSKHAAADRWATADPVGGRRGPKQSAQTTMPPHLDRGKAASSVMT